MTQMKYYIQLFIACLFLGTSLGLAQEKEVIKGNEEFNDYAFIDAREAYLKVAEDGFRSADLLQRLGDAYYFTADYKNAAKWYGALYEFSDNVDSEYLYRYAQSLKSNKQYDASDRVMEELFKSKGEDYRAKLYANERNYLGEIEQQSGRFELINIGFNSKLSDFAPSMHQGNLVIASNRTQGRTSRRVHDWNDQPFLDLYVVNTGSADGKEEADKMSKAINTKYHESTAVFSKDGNTMYFTRNNYYQNDYKEDSNGTNRLKLFRGKRTEDGWEVTELPFNNDQYSVAHPALSKDGNTLYFASDMPGGKGMSDLYKVTINGDSFGTPESLGDGINTEGRETFPFISSDDKMYFASDGHVGLGGLDVFVTEMDSNGFGEVYNVGRPVNSPMDDFTFIINDKTGIGFFASNREGGVGDDDIYSFNSIKPLATRCTQTVNGVVVDKNTKEPIPNAKVVLMDPANQIIEQLIAGADGSFSFPLDCTKAYCVRGSKLNYGFDEECFTTNAQLELGLDISLEIESLDDPKIGDDLNSVLGLLPIYFDLDKDYIRTDAQIELQKVVAFMKRYPKVKIDVRSHTDSRNTDEYNMDLSTRRNAETIAYLVKFGGIAQERLTGKGYGESELTNRCSDGVDCEEGLHQLNRRSEFIIVQQ